MHKSKYYLVLHYVKMQKVFEDFGHEIINEVEDYYDNPIETAYKYALEL